MIEYHGWAALVGADDWSDDDWDDALAAIAHSAATLRPDDGHVISGLDRIISMITVTANGLTDGPDQPVLSFFQAIGMTFPGAYGELAIMEGDEITFPVARRYMLRNGQLAASS